MKITAIILTYNRPKALKLILLSILNQNVVPDEVIIADDGSTSDTFELIANFKSNFPATLKHVWHEDKGYRISAIRNKAIKESNGDCLIFSDGDLIFHPDFFKDFKRNLKKGNGLIGSRTFLTEKFSKTIQTNYTFKSDFIFLTNKIEQNRLNAIRLPLFSQIIPYSNFSRKLRGGLLAVWKADIVAVNGWNEDFTGWGKEDTELIARMCFNGIKFRKLKFAAITYHLWHAHESREQLNTNEALLEKSISQKLNWCNNGLVKGEKS